MCIYNVQSCECVPTLFKLIYIYEKSGRITHLLTEIKIHFQERTGLEEMENFLPYSSFLNFILKILFLFLFFHIFKLLFKYSCLHFLANTFPHPTHPHLPSPTLNSSPLWLCPQILHTCSLTTFPLLSSIIAHSPPLQLLSVCSLFPCLWFYFAHLFVLLIRFHLQVRPYSICLSPPGLFHFA